MRKKNKPWEEKVKEVQLSYGRAIKHPNLAVNFYNNLFFLDRNLKEYFKNSDMEHQKKLLMTGMENIFNFFDDSDSYHRTQVVRIARTHSKKGLNIHPHSYYYWMEALIMTFKTHDPEWYDDLEHYLRETLFYPLSFIISLYLSEPH